MSTEKVQSDLDDAEIIARVVNGETEQFECLVERHKHQVFRMVSRRVPGQDVPDVAQSAMIAAFQSLPYYENRRPFGNWLAVIVMRNCCDYWRQRKARKNQTVTAPDADEMQEWLEAVTVADAIHHHEKEVGRNYAAEVTEWLLVRLEPEDRLLVDMIYLEGKPLKEAAEVLEWGLSKTKVRAMRARHQMRKMLTALEQGARKVC